MKKRIMGLVGVSLIGAMLVTSLTGCGLQTKATDIVVNDGDTVIIDQEDMSTETPETEETESVETTEPSESTETSAPDDEITSSEVIGNETEEPSDFAGAENESIVLYAERGSQDYAPPSNSEYELHSGTVDAVTDVPIYDGEGYSIGYIKGGSTVSITEYGAKKWARFDNPIAEAGYDYLYVNKDYIIDGNLGIFTTTELENLIKESLGNRNYDVPVFTETTEDMELYEFRIPMYYDSETDISIYKLYEYYDRDKNEVQIMDYKTYSVVCTKDTDDYIICQIYYKDLITEDEFSSYEQ